MEALLWSFVNSTQFSIESFSSSSIVVRIYECSNNNLWRNWKMHENLVESLRRNIMHSYLITSILQFSFVENRDIRCT